MEPGTPEARLQFLLDELGRRFTIDRTSAEPPELQYLRKLDVALDELEDFVYAAYEAH
jgi:hypothetical protein